MTGDDAEPLDRLPRENRRRLDAFSGRVDEIGLDLLSTFVERPVSPDNERSVANADPADLDALLGPWAAEVE